MWSYRITVSGKFTDGSHELSCSDQVFHFIGCSFPVIVKRRLQTGGKMQTAV